MSRLPAPEEQHLEQIKAALDAAWRGALLDLRSRVERGELRVSGVQTLPALQVNRAIIPGQWAMDYRIDPLTSVIVLNDRRYVNVLLEVGDPAAKPADQPAPALQLDLNRIPELDADTVLALLEEHARRVINGPDAKLIAPGKVSLLPLVAGMLRHRAARGELLPTVTDEADYLASWIKSKAAHYQVPTSSTIAKVLGREYAALKPRSNAAIQTLKG